jgi:hypothetical protein
MTPQDRTLLEAARLHHCNQAEMYTTLATQESIGPVAAALAQSYRNAAADHEAMAQAISRYLAEPEPVLIYDCASHDLIPVMMAA